jgi:hypothetical protein
MKHKIALVSICCGFALFPGQAIVAQAQPTSLAGSWQLTFTATSLVVAPGIPVPGLATFTSDGSVVETDGSQVVPAVSTFGGVYSTPAHGVWQAGPAVGAYVIQLISLMVNQNASLYARKTVTITGGLNTQGNFSGSYNFQVTDPSGHVVTTGSGTVAGERIPHPVLP